MGSSHESRDLNTEKRKKVQCKFVFFILQDIFEGNALCAQEFKSLSPFSLPSSAKSIRSVSLRDFLPPYRTITAAKESNNSAPAAAAQPTSFCD